MVVDKHVRRREADVHNERAARHVVSPLSDLHLTSELELLLPITLAHADEHVVSTPYRQYASCDFMHLEACELTSFAETCRLRAASARSNTSATYLCVDHLELLF